MIDKQEKRRTQDGYRTKTDKPLDLDNLTIPLGGTGARKDN